MGTSIAAALAAALVWGTTDFLGGLTSRQMHALTVVLWVNAIGLVAAAAVALATGATLGGDALGWAIASGCASGVGFVLFYAAMAIGPMSVVAPITAAGALLPATVALAGGESIPSSALLGLALALVGSVLAARSAGEEPEAGAAERPADSPAAGGRSRSVETSLLGSAAPSPTRATARVVGLAVLAGIAIGAVLALVQQATDQDGTSPLAVVAVGRAVALALTVALALALRTARGVPAANRRGILAIGIGDTAANALFAIASSEGSHAVAAVLGSLYPITTVLLARALLGERLGRSQLVGVATAFVGIALVSAA